MKAETQESDPVKSAPTKKGLSHAGARIISLAARVSQGLLLSALSALSAQKGHARAVTAFTS